jgi:hypothetical protein
MPKPHGFTGWIDEDRDRLRTKPLPVWIDGSSTEFISYASTPSATFSIRRSRVLRKNSGREKMGRFSWARAVRPHPGRGVDAKRRAPRVIAELRAEKYALESW